MLESATVSPEKNKPVFDEQTLAKLLEAAYILQEHGHELRKVEAKPTPKPEPPRAQQPKPAKAPEFKLPEPELPAFVPKPSAGTEEYSSTLGQIVATQHQIEVRQLKGDEALSLISEQLIEICRAAGAAIGLLKGNTVHYRAIAGIRALPVGSEVLIEKALCAASVRSGEAFSCQDVNPQSRNDSGECRRRGIGSLIIVPVLRESDVAGAVEVYYSDPRAFSEQDVNTCQLMAGLVGEVLASEVHSSQTPVSTESIATVMPLEHAISHPEASPEPANHVPEISPAPVVCSRCGHELVQEEQFCGECGTPRGKQPRPASAAPKPLPYWLQLRKKSSTAAQINTLGEQPLDAKQNPSQSDSAAPTLAKVNSLPQVQNNAVPAESSEHSTTLEASETEVEAASVEEEPQEALVASPDWSSALSARQFLEQFTAGNRKNALTQFWSARRGDIYLAVAVILVICAIRWGMWSNRPAKAAPAPTKTAATHKPAEPELSPFDRMLISLGLAEAPEPAPDRGSPATQVWIDLQTGLYYCPGADLYGKTSKGKYATQRNAELDQYQPAYRKACE